MLPKEWLEFKSSLSTGKQKVFIRLMDGQSITCAFRGKPLEVFTNFLSKKTSKEPFKDCQTRYRLNVIIKTPEGLDSKIFDTGYTLFNEIMDAVEEDGIDSWYIIKRKGSSMNDTKYRVKYDSPLGEEKADVDGMQLMDLEPKEFGKVTDKVDDSDLPF